MSVRQFPSRVCFTGFILRRRVQSEKLNNREPYRDLIQSKISVYQSGCKNLVDSEAMLGQLVEKGYSIAPDPSDSEIIIVNTCGFIEPAKKNRLIRSCGPHSIKSDIRIRKLIVAGCLVQRYGKDLRKNYRKWITLLHSTMWNESWKLAALNLRNVWMEPAEYIYDGKVRRIITTPGSYAYLKIAEGCDHVCSFCAIPSMRGQYRSRTISSICTEARDLAEQGVKELVLDFTGQHDLRMGSRIKRRPRDLFKSLQNEGIEWIRVMYCYPTSLRKSFLQVMAEKKVCTYIDMPLQHASGSCLHG